MDVRGIHGLETTSQNMKGIQESAGDLATSRRWGIYKVMMCHRRDNEP
jgi:hypothetical protein